MTAGEERHVVGAAAASAWRSGMKDRKAGEFVVLLLKLSVSAAILAFLFKETKVGVLTSQLLGARPLPLALCLALLVTQYPLAALRWRLVLRRLGFRLNAGLLLNLTWIAQFVNQALPTFFAGDSLKLWYTREAGVPLGKALAAVFWDRVIGVLGILVLALAMAARWNGQLGAHSGAWLIPLFAAGGVVATGLLLMLPSVSIFPFRGRVFDRFRSLTLDGRSVVSGGASSVSAFGLAILTNVVASVAVYLLAQAFGVGVSVLDCLTLVPVAMFTSLLPVSIAGWGVREGTFVYVFSFVGVRDSDALLLSVSFGLCAALVALPGAVLWVTVRKQNRPGRILQA